MPQRVDVKRERKGKSVCQKLGLRGRWWVYEVMGAAECPLVYSNSAVCRCLIPLILKDQQPLVLLKWLLL